MKIAYFGGDMHLGCITVLENHGHEIIEVFVKGEESYNHLLRGYAGSKNIPVITDHPTTEQISNLVKAGVDCLFSIEYPWLIPTPSPEIHTINVHPTLLPLGRGPTPIIWLLKKYRDAAGITFHKLSDKFDQGDIIYQQPLSISEDDNWDSLMMKLHLQIPKALDHLLSEFDTYYQNAKQQTEGSYWPKISLKDRLIDWSWPLSEINHLYLACGRFGVVVDVDGQIVMANHLKFSANDHQMPYGTLIKEDDAIFVIAAKDGIVIIYKSSILERLKV